MTQLRLKEAIASTPTGASAAKETTARQNASNAHFQPTEADGLQPQAAAADRDVGTAVEIGALEDQAEGGEQQPAAATAPTPRPSAADSFR